MLNVEDSDDESIKQIWNSTKGNGLDSLNEGYIQ